ncbi:MAG: GntR family transcriptional regulator [Clostridiales bacterium]|nr:GntR family transcriptional regulator [Clostridiales bacterium]
MENINNNQDNLFAGFAEYAAANEFVPMRELIYQYLRDAIISRKLPAGGHLVEDDLARNLNASRTPVREALRKLESEGLVKHHRRRGVEVRQLSSKEAADIYDVCMILEGYSARLVAEQADSDVSDRLHDLLEKMREAIDAGDHEKEMQLHQSFHFTIYENCNNKRVETLLKLYNDYIQLFRAYSFKVEGRMQNSWEEHDKLFRSIVLQDGNLAETRARKHLSVSKEAFLQQWDLMTE